MEIQLLKKLWNAANAVIRGHFIALKCIYIRNEEKLKFSDPSAQIKKPRK